MSDKEMLDYIIDNLNYHHIVWWNPHTEQFELKGSRQELYHWLYNLRMMLNRKYRNKKNREEQEAEVQSTCETEVSL